MDFCLIAKNIGNNLSNKYSQKLLDNAKKSMTDATRTALKSNSKNSRSYR